MVRGGCGPGSGLSRPCCEKWGVTWLTQVQGRGSVVVEAGGVYGWDGRGVNGEDGDGGVGKNLGMFVNVSGRELAPMVVNWEIDRLKRGNEVGYLVRSSLWILILY